MRRMSLIKQLVHIVGPRDAGTGNPIQDFRHTIQKENEMVVNYVRRLECYFQIAYG